MFKIESIAVEGFWGKHKAQSSFQNDVNIIIGKNGSGKTTFMNIMHAVLAVDVEALSENFFEKVSITLSNGAVKRKISATRIDDTERPYSLMEYRISNKKFLVILIGPDDRMSPTTIRRRSFETALEVKSVLRGMVSLASLSVYRLGGEIDADSRERMQRRNLSPVDQRLVTLTQQLTQYQLELSNEARSISSALQREVLTSLLFSNSTVKGRNYPLAVDASVEKTKLNSAYKQLGVSGPEIEKKILIHVNAVAEAATALKTLMSDKSSQRPALDLSPLDAFGRTQTIVELSLSSEKKIDELFSQITLFLTTLKEFIPDKSFKFDGGELVVTGRAPISLGRLSSGEKQLLILFIEALLQRRKPFIFLADEPELSLHIAWQRSIVFAIKAINPSAQIIVATHSPEIAGRYRDAIRDMEDILRD
jgi:predicted ATPase